MKLILRFIAAVAKYVAFVVGGITLFLILAPVAGYLPYSDRPGPGWHGSLPALGISEFLANAWSMLGYGLFLAVLFVIPAAVAVLVIRGIEMIVHRTGLRRIAAGVVAGLAAGYWMLGAGWYIAAGTAMFVLAVILGVTAGAWLLFSRAEPGIPDSATDGSA